MNQNHAAFNDHLPRGVWNNLKVFHDAQHHKDWLKYGDIVSPKLWLPDFPNGITDAGIHYVEETSFRSGVAIGTWYALLIDNSGYTGVDPTDTMASHSGWSEATAYDESVRQTLSFGAAASRAITASVSFTMNATKTIQGIGVTSNSTKSGTTGTLFSTALFSSPPGLVAGNVLTANYTLSD